MAVAGKTEKKRNHAGSIISFIILLLIGGAVFYFGWVQFELPEHTYAVLFSKTSGYDEEVIQPGQFNWRWERVLPTNSKLIKVKLENHTISLNYEGILPSGELYSSVLPQNPDFSYKIDFSISYLLNKDVLPKLLSEGTINADKTEDFYSHIESEFVKIIKKSCTDYFNQNYVINSNSYLDLESIILEKFNQRYSYILTRNLTISYINFPDLQLYNKSKDLYYQILDKRKEAEIATEKWVIESKINMDTKLEILSKYGELLSKYPILIDYFSLDPESQVLNISNLKDYQYDVSE